MGSKPPYISALELIPLIPKGKFLEVIIDPLDSGGWAGCYDFPNDHVMYYDGFVEQWLLHCINPGSSGGRFSPNVFSIESKDAFALIFEELPDCTTKQLLFFYCIQAPEHMGLFIQTPLSK